jgi:hypothetical protein
VITGFYACNHKTNDSSASPFNIELKTVYESEDTLFLQARSVVYPTDKSADTFITMSVYGNEGSHAYGDVYMMQSSFTGTQWGSPVSIPELKRHTIESGLTRVFGDITPDWHRTTRTILCTGKSFFIHPKDISGKEGHKRVDIEDLQEISYAVFYPENQSWSELKILQLPEKTDNGDDFFCANAGCTQRADLPDGNILLPIRYKKGELYVSTVILCSFDGNELKYLKHGTTFTVPQVRGLYEPSICEYNGEFFLTMRNDNSAYVAKSKDGLHYEPIKEWHFSDGNKLGSYNTQQHWVSHPKGLYLVYTRKGAGNDQVFRHRAPLFIAKVDPAKLQVIKETEQILMPIPENNGDLGNFGVTHINEKETWVTAPVMPQNGKKSIIYIAQLKWE